MAEDEEQRPKDAGENRPGAEGGPGGAADTPPPVPDQDDDTPLGDTDQHSDADA